MYQVCTWYIQHTTLFGNKKMTRMITITVGRLSCPEGARFLPHERAFFAEASDSKPREMVAVPVAVAIARGVLAPRPLRPSARAKQHLK